MPRASGNSGRYALALLMILCLMPSAASAELRPYKANYNLTYGGMSVGMAIYELQISRDGTVLFNARVEPRGIAALIRNDIITEQSRLRLEADGTLTALRYDYLHQRNRRTEEQNSIEFDWLTGEALTRVDGEETRLAIEAGTVDRMALQLKIMVDRLAGGEDHDLAYVVVEEDELREYRFVVRDRERISTAAGSFDTVRLERRHGSRTTIFWSAPSLGYVPVRVEQRRDGQPASRMDLDSISGPITRR